MAIVKETLLICDECGDVYASSDCRDDPGYKQRQDARDLGWRCYGGKDLCEKCNPNFDDSFLIRYDD